MGRDIKANAPVHPVVRESFQKIQDYLNGTGSGTFNKTIIDIINNSVTFAKSAAPGLRFTKSNLSSLGTYLKVGDIPSSLTAAPIHVTGIIREVVIRSRRGLPATFDLTIQRDVAGVLTDIHTVSIVAAFGAVFKVDNSTLPGTLNVSEGNGLACYISSGSVYDIVADVILGNP